MAKDKMGQTSSEGQHHGPSDPRFLHVATDPRYRPVRARGLDVEGAEDDPRFAVLKEKSYLHGLKDPRGRKFDIHKIGFSKKRPQRKEEEEASEEEEEEKEEGGGEEEEEEEGDDEQRNDISDQEEGDEEYSDEEKEKGDDVESLGDFIDVEEDHNLIKNMEKAMNVRDKMTPPNDVTVDSYERRQAILCDPDIDIARGVDEISDEESSSDDEPSSEEEEEVLYDWGELDKDAAWDVDGQDVEETCRLAVCNLDWDHVKAQDVFVMLNSFVPDGGKVERVAIFLSEFGKERLAEEEEHGPKELKELPIVPASSTDDKDDSSKSMETTRRYQLSRLKYYYAVAECNTLEVARAVYAAADGAAFKTGVKIDLRYVPTDMTFDETPQSECTSVPASYSSVALEDNFSSVNFVRPQLTWDEDRERARNISMMQNAELIGDDHHLLSALVASGSDDSDDSDAEDQDPESTTTAADDGSTGCPRRSRADTIARYRRLVAGVDNIDHAKEAEDTLLRGSGLQLGEEGEGQDDEDDGNKFMVLTDSEEEEESDKGEKEVSNLTPFLRYLEKRKKKEKERKKAKKIQTLGEKDSDTEDDERDIPDDLKNDPFFKKELEIRRKERIKRKEEKRKQREKQMEEKDKEQEERENDLSLLMLDDDVVVGSSKLVQQAREAAVTAGGKKRLSKWKLGKLKAKEKRLAKQEEGSGFVVSQSATGAASQSSHQQQATPAEAAREAVQDERFSEVLSDWRGTLDPTHPEYLKRKTPFMDQLLRQSATRRAADTHKTFTTNCAREKKTSIHVKEGEETPVALIKGGRMHISDGVIKGKIKGKKRTFSHHEEESDKNSTNSILNKKEMNKDKLYKRHKKGEFIISETGLNSEKRTPNTSGEKDGIKGLDKSAVTSPRAVASPRAVEDWWPKPAQSRDNQQRRNKVKQK